MQKCSKALGRLRSTALVRRQLESQLITAIPSILRFCCVQPFTYFARESPYSEAMWGPLRANHPSFWRGRPRSAGWSGSPSTEGMGAGTFHAASSQESCHKGKGAFSCSMQGLAQTLSDQGPGPDEGAASLHSGLGLLQPVFGALLGCLHKLLHL